MANLGILLQNVHGCLMPTSTFIIAYAEHGPGALIHTVLPFI